PWRDGRSNPDRWAAGCGFATRPSTAMLASMQRKPFRSPLAAATRHVWAVAQLTVGEALRSRFLLGVVLLGVVAMLAAAGGQAVSEADRAMLLRQTLLQLVGTITVVATLFLAAF